MEPVSNSGLGFANTQNTGKLSSIGERTENTVNPALKNSQELDPAIATKQVSETKEAKVSSQNADTDKSIEQPYNLDAAMQQVEEFISSANLKIAFSVDEATDRQVVTLKDKESGDVIRQIPSEELLNIAAQMKELVADNGKSAGLLINGHI